MNSTSSSLLSVLDVSRAWSRRVSSASLFMRLAQLCQSPPASVSDGAWSRHTPCSSTTGKPFVACRHQGIPSSENDIFCHKDLRAPQAIQANHT
ncbi:hypothetical protein LZ31DRAFT_7591 [Colletotrichum somersetense]|nr:hypothetical protein LZ31DRAFT_7591 [Colletotrichum somersetense]